MKKIALLIIAVMILFSVSLIATESQPCVWFSNSRGDVLGISSESSSGAQKLTEKITKEIIEYGWKSREIRGLQTFSTLLFNVTDNKTVVVLRLDVTLASPKDFGSFKYVDFGSVDFDTYESTKKTMDKLFLLVEKLRN